MLTTLLIHAALAAPPPLPSIELSAGAGYGATGGALDGETRGEDGPVMQVMGPALDARASLALKRGRWWQLQGVVTGWWVPLPAERLDGRAVTGEDAPYDPFLAQVHAGMALSLHPGPRLRINGGVGLVGQKFQLASTGADHTRLGVGWELNGLWTWDMGPKWAVGLGIGTTGHAVPRTGPDKTLFSGGEAGLRLTLIQDGLKQVWMSPADKARLLKEEKVETFQENQEGRQEEREERQEDRGDPI